jgi:hypothetical protein
VDELIKTYSNNESEDSISFAEHVLNHSENNKAPGENGIQMEIFKYAGEDSQYRPLYFQNLIWQGKIPPESWQKAIIVPLHKKGDIKKCENYRGISLLNSGYKIYAHIIKNKLYEYYNGNL